VNWKSFAQQAPDLAAVAASLIEGPGVCMIGTLRADGSPRISPCEPYIVDGELLLGMMPRSRKALDLLRDPRVVVHNAHADREALQGDVKVYGRVRDMSEDAEWRRRYGDATQARIDWRPDGPFHLFAVDVESAGFIRFGDAKLALRWSPGGGAERLRHPDD
jgi:pyridoxamine 5'-phosphate oxidase-like protein